MMKHEERSRTMNVVGGMIVGYILGFITVLVYDADTYRRGYRKGLRVAAKYREDEEIDYLQENETDCQW